MVGCVSVSPAPSSHYCHTQTQTCAVPVTYLAFTLYRSQRRCQMKCRFNGATTPACRRRRKTASRWIRVHFLQNGDRRNTVLCSPCATALYFIPPDSILQFYVPETSPLYYVNELPLVLFKIMPSLSVHFNSTCILISNTAVALA